MREINPVLADVLSERVALVKAQRAALLVAIQETRAARSLMFADDEHDPDGSTASLDQARDAALLVQVEHTLSDLTEAQQRLASGTYGVCEVCGLQIPTERMLARPATRRCVPCATNGTVHRRGRPC